MPVPEPSSRPTSGKSGIKGVLADCTLEQEEIRQQKWIERMEREETVERMTRGALMKPGVSSISASAQAQARALQKQERTEDNGSDDEDFLVRYRQQRIRQLQQACSPPEFHGVGRGGSHTLLQRGSTRLIHKFI